MKPLLLSLLAIAFASPAGAAEPFVKNPQDRARIEAAIPSEAYARPAKPRRLLIFTLNVGYGGHPSMAYANEAFSLMGRKTGAFETVVSNDPKVFEQDSLKTFAAVFFNNTVGNCFTNADLRRNLAEFITGGGGLMGVHGTTVAFTQWPGAIEDWPEFGFMIGARGANHKDSDEQVWMRLDDPENPILRVFNGQGFDFRDEFFRPQGTYSRERDRVLLSIDTSKTDPDKGQPRGDTHRADNDYAVAWIRNYGRGRIFYCTIAHNPYVFWDEKMLRFYLAAAQFALGDLPCPTTPSARLTPAVRAGEKLGWRLALEGDRASTLAESTARAAELKLPFVNASSTQQVAAHLLRPLDPRLTDAELEQTRLILERACVRLLAYTVTDLPPDEPGIRRLFEFARKMGIESVVLQDRPRDLESWARVAAAAGIPFALTAHSPADAVRITTQLDRLSAQNRGGDGLVPGALGGVALDLQNRSWAGSDPGRVLRGLQKRLIAAKLPGKTSSDWLFQIRAAGAQPVFSTSAARGTADIDDFNQAVLRVATP